MQPPGSILESVKLDCFPTDFISLMYYFLQLGSCGFVNTDADLVAALNPGNFANKAACGRNARVTCMSFDVPLTETLRRAHCDHMQIRESPSLFGLLTSALGVDLVVSICLPPRSNNSPLCPLAVSALIGTLFKYLDF